MLSEERKEASRRASKEYYYKNKEKQKESGKRWRVANKDYILDKQKKIKRKNKEDAIKRFGGCCNSCGGVFHPSVFEFHHVDPSTKSDKDPSKLFNLSKTRIEEELSKCIMLCANCHRVVHHGENY
jgi:hypothetical protein